MQLKQKLTSIRNYETILFILIWLVLFLSPVIIEYDRDNLDWSRIVSVWFRFFPFFIFSVIHHFLLIPSCFYKRKWVYFLSALGLLMLLNGSLFFLRIPQEQLLKQINERYSTEKFTEEGRPFPLPHDLRSDENLSMRGMQPPPPGPPPGDLPPFLHSILMAILILGFDLGLSTTFRWTKSERERELLEKERVKTELAFLRNQLSPHFFMNTLNNIHALIDLDTEEAKESIIRLSLMMRHLLYDSDKEMIPLSKEVSFIQSYVDLMKLRFTEKVKVTFNVTSDIVGKNIPPLLFTSLIENAFKYGVSYKHDSFVSITLATSEHELEFNISNSKSQAIIAPDESSTGIGLGNTRKRLDLLYHSTYQLNITETTTTFSVQLILPL